MDDAETLLMSVYNAMYDATKVAYQRKHDSSTDPEDQLWNQGKVDAMRPLLLMIQSGGYPKLKITLEIVNKVPDPITEPGTSE